MSHEPPPSQIKNWPVEKERTEVPFQWLTWFFNLHSIVESNLSRIISLEDRVLTLENNAVNLTLAGYGGIRKAGTDVPGNDLGAGWDTLSYLYDSDLTATPRGVVQDNANGTLALNQAGLWTINIVISMTHNELNQGRSIEARILNQTTGIGGNGVVAAIGRNTPGTNIFLSFMVDVTSVGDDFILQIGNGSTVSAIIYNSALLQASHVSELGTLI